MTIRYVSNTTSGAYTTGNDANTSGQAASKSTPWLTITHALAAATAGDTITVNTGTYSETAFLAVQTANFTMTSDGAVTITNATGADARVMHLKGAGTGFVLGTGFTFDAQSANASCISTDALGGVFTLHGPVLKNYTTYGVNALDCTLTLDSSWSAITAPTVSSGAGVYCNPGTSAPTSSYTISSGTVTLGTVAAAATFGIRYGSSTGGSIFSVSSCTVTATATASRTVRGIAANSGACTASITSNTVTLTATGASNDLQCVGSTGGGSATITGNTCSITSAVDVTVGYGVITGNSIAAPATRIESNTVTISTLISAIGFIGIACFNTTVASGRLDIIGNTVTQPAGLGALGGIGIQAGDNSVPTLRNSYRAILVAKNTVTGGNHGILIGWVNNYASVGNKLSQNVIGCVDKETNGTTSLPGTWIRNRVSVLEGTPGNGALRCKGSNGTVYDSNWVILDPSSPTSEFMLVNQDPVGSIVSTNCVYQNNVLYGTRNVKLTLAVSVETGSSATFTNNTYYSEGGFANNAFVNGATTYRDLAAWKAAVDTGAVSTNPNNRTAVASRTAVAR